MLLKPVIIPTRKSYGAMALNVYLLIFLKNPIIMLLILYPTLFQIGQLMDRLLNYDFFLGACSPLKELSSDILDLSKTNYFSYGRYYDDGKIFHLGTDVRAISLYHASGF